MAQNFVFNLFSTAAVASVFLLLLLELTETTRDVKKVREKGRAGAHFFVTKAGARFSRESLHFGWFGVSTYR